MLLDVVTEKFYIKSVLSYITTYNKEPLIFHTTINLKKVYIKTIHILTLILYYEHIHYFYYCLF